jgi:hypothetical protein
MRHTPQRSTQRASWARVSPARAAIALAALSACGQPTQGQDDLSEGATLNPNTPQATAESVAALINLSTPAEVPCSATFITTTHAITAARCVRTDVPASTYQLILQSPVTRLSVGASVSAVQVHPLWDGDTQLATDHVQSVYQGSATPPLSSRALYDLAVLTVSAPLAGVSPEIPGGIPSGPLSFSATSFKKTLNGVERSSELLTTLNSDTTSFTVVGTASVSDTPGGAAASVSVGGTQALLGVHAGGIARVGAVFVRLDAHQRFITDAINGSTTGDYRVTVSPTRPTDPTEPNPPTDPTQPNPPAFDCRMTSDNFCDSVCQGDIDCAVPMVEYKRFGIPCATSSECLSGVCLRFDTATTRCSEYCGGNTMCPVGFECRAAESGRLVCGTPLSNGGAPPPPPPSQKYFGSDCMSNNDCSTGLCITNGGRKWCSSRCTNDASCPISYVCATVPEGKACVPPGSQMSSTAP